MVNLQLLSGIEKNCFSSCHERRTKRKNHFRFVPIQAPEELLPTAMNLKEKGQYLELFAMNWNFFLVVIKICSSVDS